MHSDEQFGRELGVHMRRETEDIQAAPSLTRRIRRRRTRRRWATSVAATVPIAAAAVAGVLLTAYPNGTATQANGTTTQPTDNTPATTGLVDVAYVQEQAVAALAAADQYLIYSKTTYSTGYYETWNDNTTHQYRNDVYTTLVPFTDGMQTLPDGSVRVTVPTEMPTGPMHLDQSHSVTGPPGGKVLTTVDYEDRWWSQSPTEWPVDAPSEVPNMTDPDGMREAISEGMVELLGQEVVDGVDALHLRIAVTQRGYQVDLWVDSRSYLPVQETDSTDGHAAVTTTFAWLPRSEENLARLVLTPPLGFERR